MNMEELNKNIIYNNDNNNSELIKKNKKNHKFKKLALITLTHHMNSNKFIINEYKDQSN